MDTIVCLDRASVRAHFRAPAFPHRWVDYAATEPHAVVERLAGATIAVTNKVPIREAELAQLPGLALIAVAATGLDIIDLEACRRRGVAVANVRRYATTSVPEHVLMLMLALFRQLPGYMADVADGAWNRASGFCLFDRPIRDLQGATLGLVGLGDLGGGVKALAEAIGMHVIVAERRGAAVCRPDRLPFETVLAKSDVLSLHCPLTPETRHLIGPAELARMKPGAVLINTARGGLVDEAALVAALQSGHLGGAGVDVLSDEPPRHGNPLLAVRLPNLIVTPHNAWASESAMQALADQVVDNLEAFRRGERRNRAD